MISRIQVIQTTKCYARPMMNVVKLRVVLKPDNKFYVQVYNVRFRKYTDTENRKGYWNKVDAIFAMRELKDTLQSYSPS